jgi:hypothetical protein
VLRDSKVTDLQPPGTRHENIEWREVAMESLPPIQDKISDPQTMRALGFCVSVAHAEFMAHEFQRRGLAAVAVSGETPADERDAALRKLRDGLVRVVFCVDLFNEGVDVPEIDTVLFLRPTESALVFLQQLGRGLRRTDNKACLTVLDFIGGASRRFRFDLRFRALLGGHRSELIRQVEEGFPRLPSGCAIQFDRVATQVVLDNVRGSLGSTFAGLVAELQGMAEVRRQTDGGPDAIRLADFLRDAALDVSDVYKSNGWTWSRLRREAGLSAEAEGPDERRLARAVPRLLHVDDPDRLALYRRAALGELDPSDLDPTTLTGRSLMGLHFVLWGNDRSSGSLRDSMDRLRQHPGLASELAELFTLLDDQAEHIPQRLDDHMGWEHHIPLAVHARASLDEILAAFGRLTFDRPSRLREGVMFDATTNSDLFFITLEKAEDHYSPRTMYRDYAISPDLFHWESQSPTSVQSSTGQRYLHHRKRGSHVLLFARQRKHEAGRTAAYTCLGAADYVSHQGSRPIAITWRLRTPMPDDFFREAKVASG